MAPPVPSVPGWVPFPSLQTSPLLCRAPDFSNHADYLQYYSRNPGNLAGTSATPSNPGHNGVGRADPAPTPWVAAPPGHKPPDPPTTKRPSAQGGGGWEGAP